MKKLYVILDAFVNGGGQKIAQTAHGVAEFCLKRPDLASEWNNGYIVVKKTKSLDDWIAQGDVTFREPYWDHRVTAVVAFREDGFAADLPLA